MSQVAETRVLSGRSVEDEGGVANTTAKSCMTTYSDGDFCNGELVARGFFLASKSGPDTPCVCLFLDSWILDSGLKLGLACLGLAFLGLAFGATVALHRCLIRKQVLFNNRLSYLRRLAVLCILWVKVSLACLAVLAVISYSVEILLSLTVGVAVGYSVFDSPNDKFVPFAARPRQSSDSQDSLQSGEQSSDSPQTNNKKDSRSHPQFTRKFNSFH